MGYVSFMGYVYTYGLRISLIFLRKSKTIEKLLCFRRLIITCKNTVRSITAQVACKQAPRWGK